MTTVVITDPFTSPHEVIAEQLEPFCDRNLDRFSDTELLDAYDVATAWTNDLPTAQAAALQIAAEWHGRYARNLPRSGPDPISAQFAALAAQFDRTFWDLDSRD